MDGWMRAEGVGGSVTGSAFMHLFVYLILLQCSRRLEAQSCDWNGPSSSRRCAEGEEEVTVEIKPATSLFSYTTLTRRPLMIKECRRRDVSASCCSSLIREQRATK